MKLLSCDKSVATIKEPSFTGAAAGVLDTIGDGFCAIDGEWHIVHVNQRACEMWGSTPQMLIGRVLWKVFPQMMGTDAETLIRHAVEAGTRVGTRHFRR
jgi:PAS domain S-box-containing protein